MLPTIVRLDAVTPLDARPGSPCLATAMIRIGEEFRTVQVTFLPPALPDLPTAIASAWSRGR